jgi:Zn-dependent peptidase ImmA (M78 family)
VKANPEMVILARKTRGFDQGELATKLKVSQPKVSKIEASLIPLDDEMLGNIARVLGYPVEFFCQPGALIPPGLSIYHRKRFKLGKREGEYIDAHLNVIHKHVTRMLEAAAIPEPRIPVLDIDDFGGDAELIAQAVRRSWQMPTGPVRSMVQCLEDAGIVVVSYDFGTEKIDTETLMLRGGPPIVFLNPRMPGDRNRLNQAHELGHIVMHALPNPQMEDEAQRFAGEFLVPGEELGDMLTGEVTLEKLAELKPYWKASIGMLVKRAAQIGKINRAGEVWLWKRMGKLGYRKREPQELEIENEKPRLIEELLDFYTDERGYTLSDMATFLFSTISDLMSYYYKDRGKLTLVS